VRQYQTRRDEQEYQHKADQRRAPRVGSGFGAGTRQPFVWISHTVSFTPRKKRLPSGQIKQVAQLVNQMSPPAWYLRHDFCRLKIRAGRGTVHLEWASVDAGDTRHWLAFEENPMKDAGSRLTGGEAWQRKWIAPIFKLQRFEHLQDLPISMPSNLHQESSE
jgi:hypothetical protein